MADSNSTFDYRSIVLNHRFSEDDPHANLSLMIERAQTLCRAVIAESDPSIDNLAGCVAHCLEQEINDINELQQAIMSAHGGAP